MASAYTPRPSAATGSIPPTLPPSVETAYRNKCIDLKRRMNEVEESNDAYRLRKVRLMRGIRKMRLERAFLLETLGKRMRKNGHGVNGVNGTYDEDSEGSSEGPPTPQEKPLRSKRGHRRPNPTPPGPSNLQPSPPSHLPPITPSLSRANGANVHATTTPAHDPSSRTGPVRPPVPIDDFIDSQFPHGAVQPADALGRSEDEIRDVAQRQWREMDEEEKRPWNERYEMRMRRWQTETEAWRRRGRAAGRAERDEGDDGDVDMGEGEGKGEGKGEGGFTAVNG